MRSTLYIAPWNFRKHVLVTIFLVSFLIDSGLQSLELENVSMKQVFPVSLAPHTMIFKLVVRPCFIICSSRENCYLFADCNNSASMLNYSDLTISFPSIYSLRSSFLMTGLMWGYLSSSRLS